MTGTLLTRKAQSASWLRDPLWTRARMVPSLDLRMEDALLRDSVSGQRLVTFTRTSPGTYVGSDGLIKSAVTNLLLWSEEFDHASWTKGANTTVTANYAVAPNGTTTADRFEMPNTSGTFVNESATVVSGLTYTFSVYARATAATSAFEIELGTNTALYVLTAQWQRYSLSFTATGSSLTAVLGNGNNAVDFLAWGAQLERSTTVGEYIPTSATINSAPRITHDTEVGESRTNLLVRSEEFDNASWEKSATAVTANAVTAPDGTLTADALVEDTSTGVHNVRGFASCTSGTVYTFSVFVKTLGALRNLRMFIPGGVFGPSGNATFDLTFGETAGITGPVASQFVEQLPNGWYRCGLVTSAATATSTGAFTFQLLNVDAGSYTGDGTSGIYIWGAQLEEGSTATDYIPTKGVFISRATPATYYDSQGVIRTAAINEGRGDAYLPDENGVFRPIGLQLEDFSTNWLFRSEEFTGAGWLRARSSTTLNVETAPDGLTTADKLVEDSTTGEHYLQRNVAIGAGTYTHSIYVKAAENNSILFRPIHLGEASNSSLITFNLTTGPTATTNNLITGAAMQVLPNGWRRCSVTLTLTPAVTSAAFRIHLRDEESGLIDYTGDSTSGVYIWGGQVEEGSTATSYIPNPSDTETVTRTPDSSISTPVTKTPTLHRRLGLLVEKARTNLWAWSNSAVNGETWNNTLFASTAGEPDPAGGTSAILASDIGNATSGTFYQRTGVVGVAPLSAGTTVSYSIFIKPIDPPSGWVQLVMYSNGTTDNCSAKFYTSGTTFTGEIDLGKAGTGSVVSTKLETLSNGWYRLTLTGIVSTVSQSDLRTRINLGNYTRVDGTPRFVWYGAQLEEGSFPTSYIPTTGTTETRADDIAEITSGLDISRIRTLYAEFASPASGARGIVSLNDDSENNRFGLSTSGTDPLAIAVTGGVFQASIDAGTVTANQISKLAARFNADDFAASFNGGAQVIDTSGTMPTVDRIMIGRSQANEYLNGPITRLVGWDRPVYNLLGAGLTTPDGITDPDAITYLTAVETVDGYTLETATRQAIQSFIVGCKADGIWDAIKASCIMAGARTLEGALVPLKGTAPIEHNFVSGDYNRKTGLKGDGSTKYLDSNRNNNADPQNSKHLAVYFGAALSSASAVNRVHLGIVAPEFGHLGASVISTEPTNGTVDSGRYRANGATAAIVASGLAVGLKGVTRSSSSEIITRQNTANTTNASTSEVQLEGSLFVFARNHPTGPDRSNARLAYYSIGESLDLALLDARVTTLINNIATAVDGVVDTDARTYISAVESADGEELEPATAKAIETFIVGCKADGIWDAIKASCILAGARTLAGALMPLKGTAPTNSNFVSGDYNRKTGLVGNGSTKYLDSNRNANVDPQNSYSMCAWISSPGTPSSATQLYIGGSGTLGRTSLGIASSQLFSRNRSSTFTFFGVSSSVGFLGASRSAASDYLVRSAGASQTLTVASSAPANSATHIFGESSGVNFRANARLAFYSIGESLDLALLDARVTTLVNSIATAVDGVTDVDARAYISAVESADGEALEPATAKAIETFIVGCKSDGIWDAIKASCIMAGARTLAGALVPLKGTVPTNVNSNFVSGDYNRKTGLKGDGTTKYLDSGRNNNADPQNNKHLAVWISTHHTRNQVRADIGMGGINNGSSQLATSTTSRLSRINFTSDPGVSDVSTATGFWGASRASSSSIFGRHAGDTITINNTSTTPFAGNVRVFDRSQNPSDARLAFYSIGESLDLALLDSRVTTLMASINSALEPWNPSMSSPSMWLDASNISTLSLDVNNKVTQWADLSGNSYNVVPPTVGARPTYQGTGLNGQPAVYFDGLDDLLSCAVTNVSSQGDLFFAAVFEMISSVNNWQTIVGHNTSENDTNAGTLFLQRRNNHSEIGCHDSGRTDTGLAFSVQVTNLLIPRIATLGRTGTALTITATGPSQPTYMTNVMQSWVTDQITSRIQIGGRQQPGTGFFNGRVSEVIVMNRNASTLEREKVEGYLAHKWGLTGSLPSDHPFKNVTPYR